MFTYLQHGRKTFNIDPSIVFNTGFDNTVMDSVRHTATVNGTIAYNTVDYKSGTAALSISGDNYITYADTTGDLNLGASNFTLELWMKDTGSDTYGSPVCKNSSALSLGPYSLQNSSGYWFFWSAQGGQWRIGEMSPVPSATNINAPIASMAALANNWHHIAITRNVSNWNIWLDGTSVLNFNYSFTPDDVVAPVTVGQNGYRPGGPYKFKGLIDRFKLYKKCIYTVPFTPPTTV
jgi:hypothetical protein